MKIGKFTEIARNWDENNANLQNLQGFGMNKRKNLQNLHGFRMKKR